MARQWRTDAARSWALFAALICGAARKRPGRRRNDNAKGHGGTIVEDCPTDQVGRNRAGRGGTGAARGGRDERLGISRACRPAPRILGQGGRADQAVRDLVALYESLEKAKGIDKDERAELRGLVRNRLARASQRISKRLEKAGKKPPAVLAAEAVTQPSGTVVKSESSSPPAGGKVSTGGQVSIDGQVPIGGQVATGGQGGSKGRPTMGCN